MPEEHWITAVLKILLLTSLGSFYRTNGFLAVGLDCCTILLSIEVERSGLSARTVFLPQWNPCHQAESWHDALIIESTAFRLLLHPIHSLFLRPFSPRRAQFCPQVVQSVQCVLSWLAYLWYTWDLVIHLSLKNPCFSGVFCERGGIRTLNRRLKRKLRMRFFVLLWIQPVFIVFSVLFFLYFGGFLGSTLHPVQSVRHMLTYLAYFWHTNQILQPPLKR